LYTRRNELFTVSMEFLCDSCFVAWLDVTARSSAEYQEQISEN
jgi:hypothetical protein